VDQDVLKVHDHLVLIPETIIHVIGKIHERPVIIAPSRSENVCQTQCAIDTERLKDMNIVYGIDCPEDGRIIHTKDNQQEQKHLPSIIELNAFP